MFLGSEGAGGSYGYALALFAGIVAVCIIVVIRFSPERRGQLITVLDSEVPARA
jgi:SHS family lactate transporter-like MFS transporter